jgi:hypothetical protein
LLPLSALLRLAPLTLVAALRLSLPLLPLLALFSLLSRLLTLLSGLTSLLLTLPSRRLALLCFFPLFGLLLALLSLFCLFCLLASLALLCSLPIALSLTLLLLLLSALAPWGGITWLSLLFLVTALIPAQGNAVEQIFRLLSTTRSLLALLGPLAVRVIARVPSLPCGWILTGRLGDFVIDLIGEILELALSAAKGCGFVAQYAPGRPFDTLAHLLDPLTGMPGCLGRIFVHTQLGQLLGGFKRVGDLLVVRLANRIVKVFGQERLGLFGSFHGGSHLLEQFVEVLLLLVKPLGDLFALARVAQRG